MVYHMDKQYHSDNNSIQDNYYISIHYHELNLVLKMIER